MPEKSKAPFNFWQEMKRRKVFRVVAMYAGFTYVVIELTGNLTEPLHLPAWFGTLVVVILAVGFPVITILSWFFDITPEGIKKTGPAETVPEAEIKEPERRKLRLSDGIIAALIIVIIILIYPKIFNKDKFGNMRDDDGKFSVAVMPFDNLTTDSLFDVWQLGLQNLLITSLSNSDELSVRQAEPINNIINSELKTNHAGIEPSLAGLIAEKLKARTIIHGNIFKSGNNLRVTANIRDSQSEEIYKSFKVNGDSESDFFVLIDSLSGMIMNFLEIKSLENDLPVELRDAYTSSAEAYKNYLHGREYHGTLYYNSAVEHYRKALEIDSGFVLPMLYLAHIYRDNGQTDECRKWSYKAYDKIDKVPLEIQLQVRSVKAMVDKEPAIQLNYIDKYLVLNPYSTQKLYTAGWINYNLNNWEKAIEKLEKGIALNEEMGSRFKLWIYHYTLLGNAYYKIGEYKKAMKAFEEGREVWPDDPQIVFWQTACAISQSDSVMAEECLSALQQIMKDDNWPEINKISWLASLYENGNCYSKAEEYYRQALRLDSDNADLINSYANLLISGDIDPGKGIELIIPLLEDHPDNYEYLYTYGSGLYKTGNYVEAREVLQRAWDLRPSYLHKHHQLLEEVGEALGG